MSSPFQSTMAQQLVSRLAGAGRSPAVPSAPGGGAPPNPVEKDINQQLSQISGADPMVMVKSLTDIKKTILGFISRSGMNIPEVAQYLSKAFPLLDRAIKAAQEAAITAQMAGGPIANNASLASPASVSPSAPPVGGVPGLR